MIKLGHPNLKLLLVLAFILAVPLHRSRAAESSSTSPAPPASWAHTVLTVEVSRKQYDYYQPWTKRTHRLQKVGTIIAEHQILTTADQMSDSTLVRVQKNGRGRWWMGQLVWTDYHANLALVTVPDEDFWKDLTPASFATDSGNQAGMQILRWREGKLESRAAEFGQFSVREAQLSQINMVSLEVSSEMQGVGWGEPLVANSHLLGIVWAQDGRTCVTMPVSCIRRILDARKAGKYHGLGFFHFFWQSAENPATLAALNFKGEPRGVVIIDVPARPDSLPQVLKTRDILLQIDGFDLDIQGDYNDPEFGPLMLENLSTRGKWAGDDIKMKIWRNGEEQEITYRLPAYEYTNSLVPWASYDQEPEYLTVGGLVFQPLTDSYLQAWGSDWKRRSPFRLYYYNNESPSEKRPALVLLSQVMPDPYNIGYQDQRGVVLDSVNGQSVHRLSELRDALKKPQDGFHVFQFVRGDGLQRIVLAAGDTETDATTRVLKRYGISEPYRFGQ
jgi:hypothetical protein